MGYWFDNPTLKALAPLALSSFIQDLTTIFHTPQRSLGRTCFRRSPVTNYDTVSRVGG